jgi:hypothetical protein
MKSEKEETMEDGRKEGKKKEKKYVRNKEKRVRKYSDHLSTPLPGQCM